MAHSQQQSDCIDFDWQSEVIMYSKKEEHNRLSIKAIENQIICQPDLHVLSLEFIYADYFWRCVKLKSKFPKYCIDKETLKLIRSSWREHFLRLDWPKMNKFCRTFCTWRISKDHAFEEYVMRLQAMKDMGLETDLKKAFKEYSLFEIILHQTMQKELKKNNNIDAVYRALQKFGYKLKNRCLFRNRKNPQRDSRDSWYRRFASREERERNQRTNIDPTAYTQRQYNHKHKQKYRINHKS